MNVLVVAAHPGDESMGPGGSVALHAAAGHVVMIVIVVADNGAREIVEAEARSAARTLGAGDPAMLRLLPAAVTESQPAAAAERLAEVIRERSPDLIYVPHPHEDDAVRRGTFAASREALRAAPRLAPTVLAFEVGAPLPKYGEIADITPVMGVKLLAVRAYASRLANSRYDQAVEGLAAYRGALAGQCDYAEVFQSL